VSPGCHGALRAHYSSCQLIVGRIDSEAFLAPRVRPRDRRSRNCTQRTDERAGP
jgi:hypothetical protein